MAKHAIVIGAGVAGLATAGLLAREDYHVRVFEKLDAPGGRAGQLTDSGFRWDTGPSWYLMPEAYDRFFELMGTTSEQAYELVELHPAYRLFPEGSPALDVDSGVGNVATLFDALDPGAGKKVRRYLRNATDVYYLSLRHFLYTTFSNPRDFLHADILRRLPYLARLLSSSLDTWVRNRFPHPILRQILSYPAVFLSTQPSQAPALYSLMSHTDLVEGVRYPRGGFAAIMSAIEKSTAKPAWSSTTNTKSPTSPSNPVAPAASPQPAPTEPPPSMPMWSSPPQTSTTPKLGCCHPTCAATPKTTGANATQALEPYSSC